MSMSKIRLSIVVGRIDSSKQWATKGPYQGRLRHHHQQFLPHALKYGLMLCLTQKLIFHFIRPFKTAQAQQIWPVNDETNNKM